MDKKRDHLNSTRRGPQAGGRHRTRNSANSWPIAKMLAVFVVAILAIGVALASPGFQGASPVLATDGPHTFRVGGRNGTVTSDVGSIDCPSVCDDVYGSGADVQLTATPDPTWFFAGWSGGSPVNPDTVKMDGEKSVTAFFSSNCNTPVLADVVIMVDRTSTIGSEERKAQTAAANSLVRCMDIMNGIDDVKPYIAIGAYGAGGGNNNPDAIISLGLTNVYGNEDGAKDGDQYASIDDIAPQASGRSTSLADAVTVAQAELDFYDNDPIHELNQKIIVLLSAAFPNEPKSSNDPSQDALDTAQLAKDAGTEIFTIVINADSDHLDAQAGELLIPILLKNVV